MSTPTRYRARPHKIEAIHYDGTEECRAAILAFMGGPEHASVKATLLPGPGRGLTHGLQVRTFTESLHVRNDQWIVRTQYSDHKRHQALTGDAFHARYEPADDQTTTERTEP